MTTWEDCRSQYAASETTWRKSVAERVADWAMGCGYCGKPRDAHAPVDYVTADRILGRMPTLSPLTLASLHHTAAAILTPDSPVLPVEVAP